MFTGTRNPPIANHSGWLIQSIPNGLNRVLLVFLLEKPFHFQLPFRANFEMYSFLPCFSYQKTDPITLQRLTTQIIIQETGVDPRFLTKQTGTILPLESQSEDLNPKPPARRDTGTAIKDHSTPITASMALPWVAVSCSRFNKELMFCLCVGNSEHESYFKPLAWSHVICFFSCRRLSVLLAT